MVFVQQCIDVTLGFSALLSNHVEQNLCLMLISYSFLLIIHFFLGRLALKLAQSQTSTVITRELCICVCCVCVGGWATFSLLHVMTYKAKTYEYCKQNRFICIAMTMIYKCLWIMMCVWAASSYSVISLMPFRHVW